MKKQNYLHISMLVLAFASLILVAACEEEADDVYYDYEPNEAPECVIIEPISGSVYHEADTISIKVTVEDPDDNLAEVYFYINDSLIDSLMQAPFTPYTKEWMTEGLQLGTYELKAKAVDEKGYQDIYAISITLVDRIFSSGNGVTDIDGNTYPTVIIGEQEWMAENLKTTTYNDGTPIPVLSTSEWEDVNYGALCWYNDDSITSLGAFYSFSAIKTDKLCPDGWHVTTDVDWINMEVYLGMDSAEAQTYGLRGTNQGSQIAGREELWYDGNLDKSGDFDIAGFKVVPSGYISTNLSFGYRRFAMFWVNLPNDSIIYRSLHYREQGISKFRNNAYYWGISVRCVKD